MWTPRASGFAEWNRMTKLQCPEPVELGQLAEGRLGDEARRRLLEHIDQCPECHEVLTGLLSYRLQIANRLPVDKFEERPASRETGKGKVLRPDQSRFRRNLVLVFAAAAAVLLWLVVPVRSPSSSPSVLRAQMEPLLQRVAPGDLAASFMPPSAGSGFAESLDTRQRAFRLGVRLADLYVAVRLDGEGERERIGSEILRLVPEGTGAETLDRLRGGLPTPIQVEAVERGLKETEGALGAWLNLGIWAETSRLAANSHLTSYFDNPEVRDFPNGLGLGQIAPEVSDRIAASRRWMPIRQPEDLDRLQLALETLIAWF